MPSISLRRLIRRWLESAVDQPLNLPVQFMRATFLGLITLVAVTASAQSQSTVFKSAATQTDLLELFTSEGCSSCPPAETWLSSLKTSPRLWKDFVPVVFHVDYWDRLGWRDPWSSKAFSDRQRAYAGSWGNTSIYTPGFVLNGEEWRAWSGLKARLKSPRPRAGMLEVVSADLNRWQVTFIPLVPSQQVYEAHAALLASGLTSEVKAGENRGRHLEHDFVVTALVKSPLWTDRDAARGQVVLNKPARGQAGQLGLAVWVTRARGMEALQAAGGWLR